jgi:photosystem II stability/assembly factor-like uncharacterized protein
MKTIVRIALIVLIATSFFADGASLMAATPWRPIGPEGGDARSFAMDPSNPAHLYMGTVSGWMYDSHDGGAHWQPLAEIGGRNDLVLDNILVDPRRSSTVLVGAWVLGGADGGLYRSIDSGHTWSSITALKGQSIRALVRSQSQPSILVAGTLTGVYRSTDSGETWERISPPENAEIHEVESIAIDPKYPNIIYAGTWHLPWKTLDGGKTWQSIKQGLIDDSDVFSIILDPLWPETVYLSACSGIYKSVNGGLDFAKVEGIPSTARRTRVLVQDPVDRNIVYAGTTEGLYKTTDAGRAWARMTSPDVIINDISIDPRHPRHILLATDRSGVLMSNDAGFSFIDANRGVYQRQVSAMAVDPSNPKKIYVGVLNDKTYGGVFSSLDGGASWQQRSIGLAGRDVYSLGVLENGDLLAGTNRGLALWAGNGPWEPAGRVIAMTERQMAVNTRNPKTHKIEHSTTTNLVAEAGPDIAGRVGSISISGSSWYAATSDGLYRSSDKGIVWMGGAVLGQTDFRLVSAQGHFVFAAELNRTFISTDDGSSWVPGLLPNGLSRITGALVTPDEMLWLGGPEGVWTSRDKGNSFEKIKTLPINDISSISWDPALQRVLITSGNSPAVFSANGDGARWNYWNAGWPLRMAVSDGDRMMGASLFHGVVVDEPGSAMAGQPGPR